MKNRLREYLNDNYDADPLGSVRFVNRSCRMVKIVRHTWEGRRQMKGDTVVAVDGAAVEKAATTNPSWKFLPDKMKKQFNTFERAVDVVIRDMCVAGNYDDGNPIVFGNGVYAVDAARWPEAQSLLEELKTEWGKAADYWCTEEGYLELHELLRAQVGDAAYLRVKDLVPPREALRGRYWLEVLPIPFRLAEDLGEAEDKSGRKAATVELIEAAVRGPREHAAEAWRGMVDQVVAVDGRGKIVAARPQRRDPNTGATTDAPRRLRGESVAVARRGHDVLARAARFHDPATAAALAAVAAELPTDGPSQSRVAVKINGDDAEATRISVILLDAARAVVAEPNMIVGVAAAMAVRP